MSYQSTIFIFTLILNACVAIPADADTDGHIGVTGNRLINDWGVGFIGDFKHIRRGRRGERLDLTIDGRLQMGDIYRGKTYAEIVLAATLFDFGIGGKIFTDITAKGYTFNAMGRDLKGGAALTVLLGDSNVDFGFVGTMSHPMAQSLNAPNEPKGLPFKDGNALNAYIATRWRDRIYRGDVYFDIKAFWELRGDGAKAHQVHSRLQINRKVFGLGPWEAIVGAEVGVIFYKWDIHTETIAFTGLGFSF